MEHRSVAPCFLYVVMDVLKVIEAVWRVDWEPLTFCMRCYMCEKYKIWLGTSIGSPLLIFMRWFTDHACDQK
jgi:hypothetical protein